MANPKKPANAETASFTIVPVSIADDSALDQILSEVDAHVGTTTSAVNLDLQTGANTVMTVVAELRADPALYQRYKNLAASGEADFDTIIRLNRYAPALWLAAYRDKFSRIASTRAVSEETLKQGAETLDALLNVLRYHFHDHADHGPKLKRITQSSDRQALANNLRYLADLALLHGEDLANDRRFKSEVVRNALQVSSEIHSALGAKEVGAVRWVQRCAVLWTLVQKDYDELEEVGRYLLRKQPEEARRRFPPLVKGRTGKRGVKDDEKPAEDATKAAPEGPKAPAAEAKTAPEVTPAPEVKAAPEAKAEAEAKPAAKAKPAAEAKPASVAPTKKTKKPKKKSAGR